MEEKGDSERERKQCRQTVRMPLIFNSKTQTYGFSTMSLSSKYVPFMRRMQVHTHLINGTNWSTAPKY